MTALNWFALLSTACTCVYPQISEPLQGEARKEGLEVLKQWMLTRTDRSRLPEEELQHYCELLVDKGIASRAELSKRVNSRIGYLQGLGFTQHHTATVQQGLIKENLESMALERQKEKEAKIKLQEDTAADGKEGYDRPKKGSDRPAKDDSDACVICMDNAKVMVFFPCGHLCVCEACDAMMNRKQGALCIMCRAEITNRVKLFN